MGPEFQPANDDLTGDSPDLGPPLLEDLPKDIKVYEGRLYLRGVPVSEMLAFPMPVARLLLGISESTLWREVQMNKIKTTPLRLISRKEIERYLDAQSDLAFKPKRKGRPPVSSKGECRANYSRSQSRAFRVIYPGARKSLCPG